MSWIWLAVPSIPLNTHLLYICPLTEGMTSSRTPESKLSLIHRSFSSCGLYYYKHPLNKSHLLLAISVCSLGISSGCYETWPWQLLMGVVCSLCFRFAPHSKQRTNWIRAMDIQDATWVSGQYPVSPAGTLSCKTLSRIRTSAYSEWREATVFPQHQRNGAEVAGFILKTHSWLIKCSCLCSAALDSVMQRLYILKK